MYVKEFYFDNSEEQKEVKINCTVEMEYKKIIF